MPTGAVTSRLATPNRQRVFFDGIARTILAPLIPAPPSAHASRFTLHASRFHRATMPRRLPLLAQQLLDALQPAQQRIVVALDDRDLAAVLQGRPLHLSEVLEPLPAHGGAQFGM